MAAIKAELVADAEAKLVMELDAEDEMIKEAGKIAREAIAKYQPLIDEVITEANDKLGIPKKLRQTLNLSACISMPRTNTSRRAELRRLAARRLDAAEKRVSAQIDVQVLKIETDLLAGGLSDEALQYLTGMENAQMAVRSQMPNVTKADVEADYYRENPWARREDRDDDDA